MERDYPIPGGLLRVRALEERMPLDALLGFAARANPRRPFLFVSMVLGRHIPCRPSLMQTTYRLLAQVLAEAPGPVWTIGMAETAIGLGAGVADMLGRELGRTDAYFHHTTRLPLGMSPLCAFREVHSHAPLHLLFEPLPQYRGAFVQARTLVIVDDEISTGRSVRELALNVLAHMPAVEHVAVLALVDWLDAQGREAIAQAVRAAGERHPETSWHSLLRGNFAFVPDADFTPAELPPDVEARQAPPLARADLGRRALAVPPAGFAAPALGLPELARDRPVAVIGTGECAFDAFLLAEALENAGYRATVQCASRSPILAGGAIRATLPWPDPYDEGVGYHLHNPPGAEATCVVLGEREDCRVPEGLHARSIYRAVGACARLRDLACA
jgi:hypothetical protein